MFYAHFVLAKKGPLSKIWLAAHWDKKLTKAHVFETNIETSVDGILKPKVKMALRTSGHLLLGVVRIYSRKAKYLLQDCNEAFVKIKMAFRPGMVDLPEEHREAAMNAITLPEVFHDFDTAMPELNEVDIEAQFSLNQSRAEEITMREDYGSLNLVTHDDGFGDMGFDTDNPDIMRDAIGGASALEQISLDRTNLHQPALEQHGEVCSNPSVIIREKANFQLSNLLFDGSSLELGGKAGMGSGPSGVPSLSAPSHDRRMEVAPQAPLDDGFGGTIGDVSDFGHAGGLFEGDLFGDVTASGSGAGAAQGMPGTSAQPQSLQAEIEAAGAGAADGGEPPDSDDDLPDHYDAGSPGHHSWGGSPLREDPPALMPPPAAPPPPTPPHTELSDMLEEAAPLVGPQGAQGAQGAQEAGDNTTLLNNDEESFALAPVDATILRGITKTKRKRKLIVDEIKNISGEEMKNQLSNTSDIVTSLDLAPPTRRLMHWKETGGVEKLFALPARPIPSSVLFKKFQRNMTVRTEGDEGEVVSPDPARDEVAPRRTQRKRKQDEILEPVPTPAPPISDLEPPTPIPHEYEPSVEQTDVGRGGYLMTPRRDELEPPNTPGMVGALLQDGELSLPPTPAMHQAGLHPGSLTPSLGLDAALGHGGLTPAGLSHGGLTPTGLVHGGLTPAGLGHGGLTPAGLGHGGLTPAGLAHGGLTPGGLGHGGLTPGGLGHGGLTPGGLDHGGMTPAGLHHGGMTPAGLHHGGMTPSGLQHSMLLHGAEQSPMLRPHMGPPHDLDQAMDNLEQHSHYQSMQMTNLGYDEHHGGNSPQHDYDLPPSVDNGLDDEREQGETDEQFEERVLNRRAAQLFAVMRPKLAQGEALTFSDLAPLHNNRKQVAQKFYSILVLKKHQVLKLQQEETYGPLIITRGVQFETEAI